MARLQQKSRRQSPQVGPNVRPSLRGGLHGLYALSLGTGCLAPIADTIRHCRLGISTGMPGPRDFTVAPGLFVGMKDHAAARRARRIPHPTSVTVAKRPLIRGGTGGLKHDF
jgi:hypothetical protein